jgi:hypothetical protein
METKEIVQIMSKTVMTEQALNDLDRVVIYCGASLGEFVGYPVKFKFWRGEVVVQVNCLTFTISVGVEHLFLKMATHNYQDLGLDEHLAIEIPFFDFDWSAAHQLYKDKMEGAFELGMKTLNKVGDYYVRANSGYRLCSTAFSYGAFGTAALYEGTMGSCNSRVNHLEASLIAKEYGGVDSEFEVVVSGSRTNTPFWEYYVNYSIAPKVENTGDTYRFMQDGVVNSYKVLESTVFGEDVRVDRLRCIEKEITFNQGVASYETNVVSGFLNRASLNRTTLN